MTSELLWKPENIEQTNIDKFRCFVNRKRGLRLQSYRELHEWSVSALSLNDFWVDAYEFLGVAPPGSPAPDTALTLKVRNQPHETRLAMPSELTNFVLFYFLL